jgi:hypothetical protein
MSGPIRFPVTRHSTPPTVLGLRVQSLDDLKGAVARLGPAPVVASDLSLGAWQPFQVLEEFAAQLGPADRETVCAADPDGVPGSPPVSAEPTEADGPWADTIGRWIDAEGRGNPTVLMALDRAGRFLEPLRLGEPATLVVLAPRAGAVWERADALSVRYLAEGLGDGPSRIVVVHTGDEQPVVPPDFRVVWEGTGPVTAHRPPGRDPLALFPGVVSPPVRALFPATTVPVWELRRGHALIAPEARRAPRGVSRLEFDRLARVAGHVPWVKAFAQYFGNNYHVDPGFLVQYAGRLVTAGAPGIALRLTERATPCAGSPIERALLQMHAQGWRIALEQYDEAAVAPDPSPAIPPELQGALRLLKGWGMVMGSNPDGAGAYLAQGRDALESYYAGRREYLYVLNIYALSRFKAGDVSGAMAIEEAIAAELARLARVEGFRDGRLEYINAINSARVQRRLGHWDASAQYYHRAFARTRGTRTESDLVYTGVCHALLDGRRGKPRDAFLAWLRASIHWLAAAAPDAIGGRVVAAITGRRPGVDEPFADAVSGSLRRSLLTGAEAAGIRGLSDLDGRRATEPAFVQADGVPGGGLGRGVGADGWGVLVGDVAMSHPFDGPEHQYLRGLVVGLLEGLSPDLVGAATVAVDDRFGQDVPRTASELVGTCLRHRVRDVRFGSRHYRLDDRAIDRLEVASRVRLGGAVAEMVTRDSGVRARFWRYLPERLLTDVESRVLAQLSQELTVADLARQLESTVADVLPVIRVLERDRVVERCLDERELESIG